MSESAVSLSHFLHGVAAGAALVSGIAIFRSGLNPHVRWASLLWAISMAGWLFGESPGLHAPSVAVPIVFVLDSFSGGMFWLFALAIFADMRVTPLTLAPAAALLVTGIVQVVSGGAVGDFLWAARNLFAVGLALYAGVVVVRGWRDDLIEGRRRFRAALIVAACAFVVVEVAAGFANRFDPEGPWLMWVVGRLYGGMILVTLMVTFGIMALQPRPALFGAARRSDGTVDVRAEAADRQLLQKLEALMAAETWRQEGLTIGRLAELVGAPEHRLRRLINQRLGHRNFADFLNSHRIEAAKRRLADPREAARTVAAVAYDLGYGSLGPFNRAFRDATGVTPTDWRRQALGAASPELKQAV